MANVTRYKTSKGETRYRVRYRKPDGTQTDKRGFKRCFKRCFKRGSSQ